MIVTAYFSESGSPKTGLSPTVDIIDLSDNSVVVNGGAMTEVGQGAYIYNYTGASLDKSYYAICDSVTLTGDERYAMGFGTPDDDIERVLLSYVAGIATGGGTLNIKFRDQANSKDRINMTVNEDGNRSNVVVDGS